MLTKYFFGVFGVLNKCALIQYLRWQIEYHSKAYLECNILNLKILPTRIWE